MSTNAHPPSESASHESELRKLTPSARAQYLFAASAAERPAWELVARQLDPVRRAPSPPDVRLSFAKALTFLESVGHGLQWKESHTLENSETVQIKRVKEGRGFRHYMHNFGVARRTALAVASCAAIAVAGVWAQHFWVGRFDSSAQNPVAYITRNAQRATVVLLDGTYVRMNVGSVLRVPVEYGAHSRTVYLDGEAEFTVEHNRERPFVVHSGTTIVRDLATRFIVRTYADSENSLVAVANGRVSVQSTRANTGSSSVVVNGGESASVGVNGEVMVAEQSPLYNPFAWTDGRLAFANVPVREALAQIARWYDVECESHDSVLLSRSLTYTFTDATLTDRQLNDLADVLGAYVVRQGRVITFISRK